MSLIYTAVKHRKRGKYDTQIKATLFFYGIAFYYLFYSNKAGFKLYRDSKGYER